MTNYGKTGRAVLVLLSGTIICSIADVLLLLWLADPPKAATSTASASAEDVQLTDVETAPPPPAAA